MSPHMPNGATTQLSSAQPTIQSIAIQVGNSTQLVEPGPQRSAIEVIRE